MDRNTKFGFGTLDGWQVALRKESVDRNGGSIIDNLNGAGRSPQGERG